MISVIDMTHVRYCRATMLVFLACATFSPAQSIVKIQGHVRTSDARPLAGANIAVLGTNMGAATDMSGYYRIENLFAGEYDIEATYIGYRDMVVRDVRIAKDVTTRLNLVLEPDVLQLAEVVVDANRQPGPASSVIERLSRSDIETSGASSVGEILRQVAGIDVLEQGTGSAPIKISMRGSDANQVLVILDGVPLNDPLTGETDLAQISLATIDEIVVHKGGASAAYGNGALAGVIEIRSRNYFNDELRLTGSMGSFGAVHARPVVSGSVGRLSYYANVEYIRENGDYPYTYKQLDGSGIADRRLNAGFSALNYFGKVLLDFASQFFSLQASIHDSDRGLPGRVFQWTPYANGNNRRRMFAARYRITRPSFSSDLHLSRNDSRSEYRNNVPHDAPLRFKTVGPFFSQYGVLSHRLLHETRLKFGSQQAKVELSASRDRFDNADPQSETSAASQNILSKTGSLALSNEWQIPTPAFLSTLALYHSVRLDHLKTDNHLISRRYTEVSPNIGILLSTRSRLQASLRGNYGRAFRTPTYADLFYQDLRVKGNPDLLPEKSTDWEVAGQLGWLKSGAIQMEASYFHHNVQNMINWELGSFATWQPYNTDALLRGWEFAGRGLFLRDRVNLGISHTILHATDRSGRRTTHGKTLAYRPEHSTKLNLGIDLNHFSIIYLKRLVGSRYQTAANTILLKGYTVDDLTLTLRPHFSWFSAQLKMSIFNIFNRRYEIVERLPLPGLYWRASLELVY
jgi:outer membrane cobalamin receptor